MRSRRTAAVALLAAALAACTAPAPPPVDRFAVDEVAQRYRALGADLLSGVLRCGPADEPGAVERVHCDFGSWALDLATYDTREQLQAARDRARQPAPDSARSAAAAVPGAAFVMDETLAGATRVHWDAEAPRPVSATATATALPLSELLEHYDQRRFTAVQRPEQPGAAFVSPVLWKFAAPLVTGAGASCRPQAPGPEHYDDVVEQVACGFPGGIPADFALTADDAEFLAHRQPQLDGTGAVPGTHRVRQRSEDAVLVEMVFAPRNWPYLYYDRRDLRSFALVWDDVLTQEQLYGFWADHQG